MKLKAMNKRLVVLRAPKPANSFGIIIPDLPTEKSDKGRVLSVGSDIEGISEGDMVLFVKYSGVEVKLEGVPMLVMCEGDIIARLSEPAKTA